MTERRRPSGPSLGLVVLAVFAVALAARLAPLFWSPLPATLDGFRYARLAERLLSTGALPLTGIQADEFVFTLGLAFTSAITGIPPLRAAQIFVSIAGAGAPAVGAALAYRLALERGWTARRVRLAATLAGLGLALDGIFLRRTGVPDEEALGLLLVPLLALVAHRWLTSGGIRWGVPAGLLLLALPPLHNLSSLIGVLSVSGLVAIHGVRAREQSALVRALVLGLGAWGIFLGYFEAAARLGLELTYSGLLRPYPGLFLAWVVLLVLGAVWVSGTTARAQRTAVVLPIGVFFLIVGLNTFTPVFPGTVPSPPIVVVMILGLAVPVVFAGGGLPSVKRGTGPVALATLLAPIGFVYFALSASLTPEFFDAVLRVQSFAHLPAFALAGVGVVAAASVVNHRSVRWRRGAAVGVVVLFAAAIALTLPLGYVNLDSGSYPSTTFRSEFEGSEFATEHVDGTFATDHSLSKVVLHYHTPLGPLQPFGVTGRAAVGPTRSWMTSGQPPDCPVLSQASWTTTGAHLYPTPPGTVSPSEYRQFVEQHNVVYTAGGYDPLTLTLPSNGSAMGEAC